MVDPNTYNSMKRQMPSRYGDFVMCVKPDHTLPPITSACRSVSRLLCPPAPPTTTGGQRMIVTMASSSSTAETSSTFTAPNLGASAAVSADPLSDPNDPPTAMNPNSRFACSLVNASAIKHQKIEVWNSANTVIHTKNARPIHTSTVDPSPAETK